MHIFKTMSYQMISKYNVHKFLIYTQYVIMHFVLTYADGCRYILRLSTFYIVMLGAKMLPFIFWNEIQLYFIHAGIANCHHSTLNKSSWIETNYVFLERLDMSFVNFLDSYTYMNTSSSWIYSASKDCSKTSCCAHFSFRVLHWK